MISVTQSADKSHLTGKSAGKAINVYLQEVFIQFYILLLQ